jgi:hypothetical protein
MGFFHFWRGKKRQHKAARASRNAGTRPRLEQLESRLTPASVSGNVWPNPQLITLSFVPDGTTLGSNSSGPIRSDLFATFNARFGSAATWENVILKAAQTWAAQTNLNFAAVPDNGGDLGSGGDEQGDPGMGDIRVGGCNFGTTTLATAYQPPPVNNYSIAGDIQFNTRQNFSTNGSAYDLFTVAAHEIGHSLGLGESTVSGAVMYGYYKGVKRGLATDDVSGIRSIYSNGNPRSPDQYHQGGATNGSFTAATDLTARIDPVALTASVGGLDMTNATDQDCYTFTAPSGTTGQLRVSVQSQGLSLLAPNLTVCAADQTTVLGSASGAGRYGTTLTVTVNGVTAGQRFYVKVTGADTGVFATGRYALTLDLGSSPPPAVPLPVTTTANGPVKSTGGGQALVTPRHHGNPDALEPEPGVPDPDASAPATTPGLPDGSQGTANQRLVAHVYLAALGRPVDAAGLAYWSSFLDAGASPDKVAQGILASPEYRTTQVQALFHKYLRRDADAQGLTFFGGLLQAGGTQEQATALLTASDEYLARAGGSAPGWLDAFYHDTFGRAADAVGQSFADQALAGGASRAQVAAALLGSDEYRQGLLQHDYQQYLGRSLDAVGQAVWLPALRQGVGDDVVLALILGGSGGEFFPKTAS